MNESKNDVAEAAMVKSTFLDEGHPIEAMGAWSLFRPLAFSFSADLAHELGISCAKAMAMSSPKTLRSDDVARHPSLRTDVLGIKFPNPLGLAAGIDKGAEAMGYWQKLGFGFVEVGTVTAHAQPGNPKPRLFRLSDDGALMNRMGFNNDGAKAIGARLAAMRDGGRVEIPVGVNIGKSKVTPNSEASADYRASFRATAPYSDYVVVNVSSPNTPGLRDLQQTDELKTILDAVLNENEKLAQKRPVLVKLAPDLSDDDAIASARLSIERGIAGLILTNTSVARDALKGPVPPGLGGISGVPLFRRSTALLKTIRAEVGDDVVLVGVGGISDGVTAATKRAAGARLLQIYSAFIYAGPALPRAILQSLVDASEKLSSTVPSGEAGAAPV